MLDSVPCTKTTGMSLNERDHPDPDPTRPALTPGLRRVTY
jgi:hypothetical protein